MTRRGEVSDRLPLDVRAAILLVCVFVVGAIVLVTFAIRGRNQWADACRESGGVPLRSVCIDRDVTIQIDEGSP